MAKITINELPTAISLTGNELVPIDQSDGAGGYVTKRTTAAALTSSAPNVPYIVAGNVPSFPNSRTLSSVAGQTLVVDGGPGGTIGIGLASPVLASLALANSSLQPTDIGVTVASEAQGALADTAQQKFATISAMASSPIRGFVSLYQAGREGTFLSTTSNISALVAIDTTNYVSVPFSADPTGASGGWLRKFSGDLEGSWGGVVDSNSIGSSAAMAVGMAVANFLGLFLNIRGKNVLFDANITVNFGPKVRFCDGVQLIQAPGVPMFYIQPSGETFVSGQGNTLASDVTYGSKAVTLAAGKGANFAEQTYVAIVANNLMPGSGHTSVQAEFAYIDKGGISGDVLTFDSPLTFDYTVANAARVYNLNQIRGVELDFQDAQFIGAPYNPIYTNFDVYDVLRLTSCYRPILRQPKALNLFNTFMRFRTCYYATVFEPQSENQASVDFTDATWGPGFGYQILEEGLNAFLTSDHSKGVRIRHNYTTGELPSVVDGSPINIGVPMWSKINDGLAIESRGTGFDTHPPGFEIEFNDCEVRGAQQNGFQTRSYGTKYGVITAHDCVGAILSCEPSSRATRATRVVGSRCATGSIGSTSWLVRGSVWIGAPDVEIEMISTDSSGGPAISFGDGVANTAVTASIGRIVARSPCKKTGSNANAILITTGMTGRVDIGEIDMDCAGGNATVGIANGSSTVRMVVKVKKILNVATMASTQVGDIISGGGQMTANGVGSQVTLSIASDTLTITGQDSTYFSVNGEGGLADNLATIADGNFYPVGTVIVIAGNSTAVTIIHNATSISLKGAANVVISNIIQNVVLRKTANGRWSQQ